MIYVIATGINSEQRAKLTHATIAEAGGESTIIEFEALTGLLETLEEPTLFVRAGVIVRNLPKCPDFGTFYAAAVPEYSVMGLARIDEDFLGKFDGVLLDSYYSDGVVWLDIPRIRTTKIVESCKEDAPVNMTEFLNRYMRFLVKQLPRKDNYLVMVPQPKKTVESVNLVFNKEDFLGANCFNLLSHFPDEPLPSNIDPRVYACVFEEIQEYATNAGLDEMVRRIRYHLLAVAGVDFLIEKIIALEDQQSRTSSTVEKLLMYLEQQNT